MENFDAFQKLLAAPRKISIISHHNPDADALGSSLALSLYLRKKGHTTQIIMPSAYPSFLEWMPYCQQVISYTPTQHSTCEEVISEAEVIFCLDFSTYSRAGQVEALLAHSRAPKIIIDHHQNPNMEVDFWLWSVAASSTAELVYTLIEMLDDLDLIDKEIGACIYAGIVTDTASFKNASTTKKAHQIAAHLIELGVETAKIQGYIYDNNSENRMRFLGYTLLNKLTFLPEYRTAYITLTGEELNKYQNQLGDSEGLVDYALSLKGVVLAVAIIERGNCVKMSFRSVGNFPANLFAQKHFGGGGHKNSAGSDCVGEIAEVEKQLLALLPSYQTELNNADK